MRTVAEKLNFLVCGKGVKAEGLARAVKVSEETIWNWLNDLDMPALDDLITVSEEFGCTVDFLLGLDDPDTDDLTEPRIPAQEDSPGVWGIRGGGLQPTERGIIVLDGNAGNVRAIEAAVSPYFYPLKIIAAAKSIGEAEKYISERGPYGVLANCVVQGRVITESINRIAACGEKPVVVAYGALDGTVLNNMRGCLEDKNISLASQESGFQWILGKFFTEDYSSSYKNQVRRLRKTDVKHRFHWWEVNKKGEKREIRFENVMWRYIGYRLRAFREQKGIPIQNVNADSILTPTAYRRIEYGANRYVNCSRWKVIERALGAKQEEILGMEEYALENYLKQLPWIYLDEYNTLAPAYYSSFKSIEVELEWLDQQ